MAANLTTLFKFFIILLMFISIFFIIRQFMKRSLRGVIINIIGLLILIILYFVPNYMKNLPIQSREISQQSGNVVNKTIIIATEGTYFPWNYVDAEGKPQGFDVDIAKEIAKRLNMTPKFIITPFDSLVTNLSNKQYDMVVSSMSITKERRKNVDFSIPYVQVQVVFFGKKGNFQDLKDADISTLKKYLKGKTVGTQIGTTWPFYLEKEFKGIVKVKYYNTQPQLMMEVNSGRLDVGFSELPSVIKFINKHSNIIMFGPKLGINDAPILGEGIAVAVSKSNKKLLNKINTILACMHEDGTIKKLSIKHFGIDMSYDGKK